MLGGVSVGPNVGAKHPTLTPPTRGRQALPVAGTSIMPRWEPWMSGLLIRFHTLPDRPGHSKRVLELAIDVAPEFGLERRRDFAAGGDGAVPPQLGVVDMDMHVEALRS